MDSQEDRGYLLWERIHLTTRMNPTRATRVEIGGQTRIQAACF